MIKSDELLFKFFGLSFIRICLSHRVFGGGGERRKTEIIQKWKICGYGTQRKWYEYSAIFRSQNEMF